MAVPVQRGQSLTEYILPIGLVAIVSMVTLLTLPGLMSQVISDTNKGENIQNTVNINPLGSLPDGNLPSTPNGGNYQTVILTLKLSNGTIITLDQFPRDLSEVLQKEDPHGGTGILSLQIKALAEKMKNQLSAKQYQDMMELADQGFRMAAIQQEIDRVLKEQNLDLSTMDPATRDATLSQLMISTPEGTQVSLKDAIASFQFDTGGKTDISQLTPKDLLNPKIGSELKGFLQKFMDLYKNGTLKEDPVRRLMNYLVFRIGYVGDMISESDSALEMQTNISALGSNRLTFSGSDITCQDTTSPCSI